MNSQRGAIPKTSRRKVRARPRLPSSDSEDDIQVNTERRNVVTRGISKQGTLNSPKPSIPRPSANCFSGDMENISLIIISPHKIKKEKSFMSDIMEADETDKCIAELNEIMKKYEKESMRNPEKKKIGLKAAEEIGRAALTVSQTKVLKKNSVVDLRHKSLNRGNVKVEPRTFVTVNSTKAVTASEAKPIFIKSKSCESTKVTNSVNNSRAVPIEPQTSQSKKSGQKHGAQRDIRSYTAPSANGPAALKKSKSVVLYNPATSKRPINKISILNTGFATRATQIVSKSKTTQPLTSVAGKGVPKSHAIENKESQDVNPIDLCSPCVSNTLKKVDDSPPRGLFLECPICFEHLLLGRPTVITSCGHMFCRKCMASINFRSNKCPICRVVIRQLIDIHV